jgi:hypothetical protein
MTPSANSNAEPLKHFAMWLSALFLIVLGAKLWVVQLYGTALPWWDQWTEANVFFRPWVEGHLTIHDWFAAHNEHRIFFTRLLDLTVIQLNGRWEPMLQMTVNAFIHAGFACTLAFYLWDFLGRKNGWLVCSLLAPFFALPYGAENTTWAFNSQAYLMCLFALATLVGLGFGKTGGWRWWLGLTAAGMGLFTMAGGLLAPMAVAGLILLRAIKARRLGKEALITLAASLMIVALGVVAKVSMPEDAPLRAHSLLEFAAAFVRNLAWPFIGVPWMACFVPLPLVGLLVCYFRPGFQQLRAAEFLLVLALWSLLQSAAIAYGRANYGGGIPASRYMDVLSFLVVAGTFAAVLLRQIWGTGTFSKWAAPLLPLVFITVILFSLVQVSQSVVDHFLIPTRLMSLNTEERINAFLTAGDERELFETPGACPDPQFILAVLQTEKMKAILPAGCLSPTLPPVSGRFSTTAQWLLKNSPAILMGGLILFASLCGLGLVRKTLGLAGADFAGTVVLLAALTALGFVWSKSPVQRRTIERDLHYRLALAFTLEHNPKRAAIHERLAEALKSQHE